MKRKCLAFLAAFVMLVCLMPGMALADDTVDVSGDVIQVTNATAQDVLDGKYGDITGKTIHFTENITTALDLARPTAYEGSKTVYYNYQQSNAATDTTPTAWSGNIGTVLNAHSKYVRTLSGVTFTAAEGVTVAGFTFDAGHNHTGGYDYVRNVATGNGVTFYDYGNLENITFQGLTITGNVDFDVYLTGCSVENITFDNCTFTAGEAEVASSEAAISMSSDDQYFVNVTVTNCTISGYYQGVYIQGVDGATIANNSISNTTHNAIAVQSSVSNVTKGTVSIVENYIENTEDRAIRFSEIGAADITVNNNMMPGSKHSVFYV